MAIENGKWKRKPTIADAFQVTEAGAYPGLGTLTTDDVILVLADGSQGTTTETLMGTDWIKTDESATLVGDDID